MADILKVHDYRYINQVMNKCQFLKEQEELAAMNYDQDTRMSSDSWMAALLSTGSIIEGVDRVMTGEYKNSFCAVRPPGHHAGVFGSTFKNNECDKE